MIQGLRRVADEYAGILSANIQSKVNQQRSTGTMHNALTKIIEPWKTQRGWAIGVGDFSLVGPVDQGPSSRETIREFWDWLEGAITAEEPEALKAHEEAIAKERAELAAKEARAAKREERARAARERKERAKETKAQRRQREALAEQQRRREIAQRREEDISRITRELQQRGRRAEYTREANQLLLAEERREYVRLRTRLHSLRLQLEQAVQDAQGNAIRIAIARSRFASQVEFHERQLESLARIMELRRGLLEHY